MQACPHCGTANQPGAKFCTHCGKALAAEGPDPLIGRNVGAYKILSVIGAGGMGRVYKAQQTKLQRIVCVKTLLPELANDPAVVTRFEREGVATALIRHPNIVGIFDFGRTEDNILYIAMEYVEGRTMRTILRTESPTPARRAINLTEQILAALDEAHASGVVHRDLKPANVLVSKQRDGTEVVKVVDFGIAKLVGGKSDEEMSLTRTGMMVGSLGYMAPEQIMGNDVGGGADLYAAGVILWELLVGRRLFTGKSELELAQKHTTLAPESPSAVASLPIPAGLDEVVLKSLEKTPERRYQTAREFRDALEHVTASEWGGNTPSSGVRGISNSGVRGAFMGPDTASRSRPSESALIGLRGVVPDQLLAYATELPKHVVGTEKRLLTVAYGELSGQSALSEAIGAPAMKSTLQSLGEEFIACVTRHEGRAERLPGAGFVIVFGLLNPHEDDPQRAVNACFEMLAAVETANRRVPKPLQLRIGIHAATVTSAYDESSLSDSLGVAEVVAVSRRILSTVGSGSIIGSKPLEKLVRAHVQGSEREVVVNGQKQEPVFELTGLAERTEFRKGLIGRTSEVNTLAALVEVVRNRKPAGMLLVGAPGYGKTRMLAEAATLAKRAGLTPLSARGGRTFGNAPYDVVRQLLQSLMERTARSGGTLPNATSPYAGLSGLGISPIDVMRIEKLFAATVKVGEATGSPKEDDVARDRAALLMAFDRASARGPILLLVDDYHLADEVSRDLIDELQRRASKHPFGFIATARPGDISKLAPKLKRMELSAFDEATTSAMVTSLLGSGTPSAKLVEFIQNRSDGNPFFIEELVHSLIETTSVQQVGQEWELQPNASEAVPEALAMVVSARVERVSAGARSLLRVGAVIGRTFQADLAAAASSETVDAKVAVEECVRRGLLVNTDQPGQVRFEQSLLHEVMLQRLTSIDLKYLHQRVAEALERGTSSGEMPYEAMSKHFLAAEQVRKAIRYLRLAADRHFERGAFVSAVDNYKQCLDLARKEAAKSGAPSEQMVAQLLDICGRTMAAQIMVAPDQALTTFAEVVPGIPSALGGATRAEPLHQKGIALTKLSRYGEAEAALKEALQHVASGEPATLVAHIRSDLANTLEAKGDLSGATTLLLDGLKLVSTKKVKDDHLLWQYLNGLGRLHLRAGKVQPAEEFFENARNRAKQVQSAVGESKAIANLAVARAQRGDAASALALFSEALELAEKAGDRLGALRVLYNRARVLMKSNPPKAMADLETVVEEARDIGWREGEGLASRAQQEFAVK
ncbi:MAG: protein kinase [Archangium sp.]|nr:protein kinase [Archangium sp.]